MCLRPGGGGVYPLCCPLRALGCPPTTPLRRRAATRPPPKPPAPPPQCGQPDVKIISNRAAAMLAMDKFVAAAFDGQRCIEVDRDWWKGHWYRGQALMKMLKGKPPSTSMAERCEQAKVRGEGGARGGGSVAPAPSHLTLLTFLLSARRDDQIAFQDCLKTTTLPDAKVRWRGCAPTRDLVQTATTTTSLANSQRPQVEMELQNSKNTLMSMTTACNQS